MTAKNLLYFGLFLTANAQNGCRQTSTQSGPYCACKAPYCDPVPALLPLTPGEYQLYSTSKEKLGFYTSNGKFSNFTVKSDVSVQIPDLSKTRQTIVGFGGAFTDATGENLASLTNRTRELLLESYFGATGIGYSLARVPIGGTDFSSRGYTLCDRKDENLSSFALQEEDYKFKLPFIQRAQELRGEKNLKLLASAWSAPAWMKTNEKLNGFGKIREKYYGLWADYYLKFFEAYEAENVTFWGVTTQNEPVDGLIGTQIQNNGFKSGEMKKWIKEAFGPAIRNSSYNSLKIILHDDQRIFLPFLKWFVLSDKEVVRYADGIGVHFYTDFFVPGFFLDFATAPGKSLFRLATEGCGGSRKILGEKPVDLGSWARAETYLSSIFIDLKYDFIGWIDWNMALNTSGGPSWIRNEVDSPILVDSEKDEFYKQPTFYAMGHFSKFVTPGSVRVENIQKEVGKGIEALSFLRPDGKIVVVLWNKSKEAKSVTVRVENLAGNLKIAAQSINSLLLGL